MFEFTCRACGISIAASAASAGAVVSCPTCGTEATVPHAPSPRLPPPDEPPPAYERRLLPRPADPDGQPDWVAPFWLWAALGLFAFLTMCCCTGLSLPGGR